MNDGKNAMEMARRIAEKVSERGGAVYCVGGFVRDRLMGIENKDIDIEVHGVTPAELEAILDSLGERMSMGESFGIYGLKGYELDIAMPRKETLRGHGHRDFDIFVDPFIGTKGAAMRRDFTVNAMMQNVLTGEIVDEYGGRADLENKILRHVNDMTFPEDALRVLRGAQFAARFGFEVAEETVELCSRMPLDKLARERVLGEIKKALTKAEKPSIFFETLRKMNQLDVWFPELKALIGVEQNPKFHSEGDVWVHTMMVLDEAAKYRGRVKNPLGFMLAAVTHDFGKAVCTERVNGVIHAYRHESEGVPIAEKFMRRLTDEAELIKYVLNLTELHMKPNVMAEHNSAVKSTNKLFDDAVDPEALICIATADVEGKTAPGETVYHTEYLEERLAIYREYMARPYVMGKDLIAAGLKPGPDFSEYLGFAHKLRLAGVEKDNALKQTLAMARKNKT